MVNQINQPKARKLRRTLNLGRAVNPVKVASLERAANLVKVENLGRAANLVKVESLGRAANLVNLKIKRSQSGTKYLRSNMVCKSLCLKFVSLS